MSKADHLDILTPERVRRIHALGGVVNVSVFYPGYNGRYIAHVECADAGVFINADWGLTIRPRGPMPSTTAEEIRAVVSDWGVYEQG